MSEDRGILYSQLKKLGVRRCFAILVCTSVTSCAVFVLVIGNYSFNRPSWLTFPKEHGNIIHDIFTDVSLKQVQCYGKGIKPVGNFKIRPEWNLLNKEPFDFLPNFKNPCYNESTTNARSKIRCLPYFIIIGAPKCGTTDIWRKIAFHPDVSAKHQKELNYFNSKRFYGKNGWTFNKYLNFFDEAAHDILKRISPAECHGPFPFHYMITGDGSVDILVDNNHWPWLPGNENCNEPAITNSDVLYHLNPKVKLIVALRDPVERAYSDYIYEARFIKYKVSPSGFHRAVEKAMAARQDCLKYFTERGCAYNWTLENFEARLRIGLYHIFLKDWLSIFPRDQMLILRTEDLENESTLYKEIFKFLEIRPFTTGEEHWIFSKPRANERKESEQLTYGEMLPSTRHLLEYFYRPHNEKLALLLNDSKFLWN